MAAAMDMAKNIPAEPRPVSAVSVAVGLSGLAGLFLAVLIARNFGAIAAALGFPGLPERADGPYAALVCVLLCGLPMVCWSLFVDKVHRRASTGIDWSLKRPVSDVLDDSIVKITGLWVTWGLIAAIYGLFRFWWNTQFANFPFSMQIFEAAAIPLVLISVPYVVWLDRYLVNIRDGAWHLGAWVAGRDDWEAEEIFHHLRAWAVKGFFLAFMISIVPGLFGDIVRMEWAKVAASPVSLTHALISSMFLIDVQIATVGYLLTMKPLDAHIRTANPYLAGWLAALMCYPPFTLMAAGGPFDYHIATSEWHRWFYNYEALLWVWGAVLVALTAFYAWATFAFGLRFSNLTHRGIITNGPYAFTKHPAYLSKNTYWWLSTLPFFATSGSLVDAIRNTLLLGLVSAIYYWRAKTEERHLLADPDYKAYALWMDRNAAIPRFFQSLKKLTGTRLGRNPAMQPAE
jgi:Isoprenylcysteine carboxyl methyltransferase (ICMT) family